MQSSTVRKSITSADYRSLLELMRRTRIEGGFTQEGIASKLGISASQLSEWERGERRVDASELRLFCLACEINIADFIADWERGISS
jgi:transcriptional regulator with XRE-family HTH domain